MNAYRISSKAGVDFGVYEGDTPEAAFAAMVAEGGDGVDSEGGSTSGSIGDWIIEPVSDAEAFVDEHGDDAADVMDALNAAGFPADQDWANERTTWTLRDGSRIAVSDTEVTVLAAGEVLLDGRPVDMAAARALMDDDLADEIHGTVDNDQSFVDAYSDAHRAKFGADWVFG